MEILFNNPFVFIILIAVISSLVKKRKGTTGRPKSQKGTSHPIEKRYKQPSSPFDEVKEIFKEVVRSLPDETNAPARKLDQTYRKQKNETEQKMKTLEQGKTVNVRENEDIKIEMANSLPVSYEQVKVKEIEADATKIVDAVIWAEILGPPRAKKSYMRTKNRS